MIRFSTALRLGSIGRFSWIHGFFGWGCVTLMALSLGLLQGETLQMIVATAPDGDSHRGELRLFDRESLDSPWRPEGGFVPVLLGRHGLAWGLGLHPGQSGLQKVERDGRSPAGIFRVGLVLGSDPALPVGAKWTYYHQITANDAWPDDPALPIYNQLFTLSPGAEKPPWFEKHRMRLEDPAYHWLVLIEHNYPYPVAGRGSAIFLHTRRGEDVPSAGCTVMDRSALEHLILWLDPAAQPVFVLLTRSDYRRVWLTWHLPPPRLGCPQSPFVY